MFNVTHYQKNAKETADVTYRYYLSDAVFLAGLEGDQDFLQTLEAAVLSPVWPLYRGRRSCPPTLPLVLGIRDLSLEKALRSENWQASDWTREQWLRRHQGETLALPLMMDSDGTGYGQTIIQDIPLSFDQRNREHGFRAVEGKTPVVLLVDEPVGGVPTEHDAFAEVGGI